MNKNQSKYISVGAIVLAFIGLVIFGWFLFKEDNISDHNLFSNSAGNSNSSDKKSTDDSTSSATESDTNTTTKTNDPLSGWLSFSKEGFSLTFKYPKNWVVNSATNSTLTGSPVKQTTVKIITDTGTEFHFDNPATEADFEGYDLKNNQDITAGTITFKRSYGLNSSNGQTLYLATYTDPNNLDAASVSFYGADSNLDATLIANLDKIVSSFKFIQ